VQNNPVNFVDPWGLYESHWIFSGVPGQHLFDLGMTAGESGNYSLASLYFAGMLTEQVLFTLTLGQGGLAKQASECVLKTTARTVPANLAEQLALKEAKAGAGKRVMEELISDPNYPKELWAKMQHVHNNPDGTQIIIHYWKNVKTGISDGFKFKN
jgi:hypothetical protein